MSKEIEDKLIQLPIVKHLYRFAKSFQIPRLNGLTFYDLLELYILGIAKGALSTRASAIAFSFFTAIFPFLLFILFVIPYIPVEGFEKDFLHFLDSFLPPQTSEFFFNSIFNNISHKYVGGGLLSSVFVVSLMLMTNGVNAIFTGFKVSYHKREKERGFIKQYLSALSVALMLAFLVLLSVVFLGYFEIYVVINIYDTLRSTGIEFVGSQLLWVNLTEFVFFVFVVYFSTAILYYYGVKEGSYYKFFSVGATFTTIITILTSYLFGVYINKFSNYNELYGSIGALLILLFYLWINSNILLLGFELNASLNTLKAKKE